MDNEPVQFCSNCQKNVGAAIFATHSAFCQKKLKIHQVSDDSLPNNPIKVQTGESQIFVKCEKCKASIKKWKMPKHQEVCPTRLVTCEFCKREFNVNEAKQHTESCGSRTQLCELCGNNIMLKNKQLHLQFHQYEENRQRETGAGNIHQNNRNELINKTSEKSPQNHVMCHLCKQLILRHEYDRHLKSCAVQNCFKKCPRCNENIPPFSWKDHSSRTCKMLKDSNAETVPTHLLSDSDDSDDSDSSGEDEPVVAGLSQAISRNYAEETKERKVCAYCDQELHVDASEELHLRVCEIYKQINSFQTSSQNYAVFTEERKVCAYCDQQLHGDASEELHLRVCEIYLQINSLQRTSLNYAEETDQRKICAYCEKELHAGVSEEFHLRDCEIYKQISSSSSDVSPKTHHVSTSEDLLRCIICIDKQRDTMFQPCGHLVVCDDCAKDVGSTCPMCRKSIKTKIKAYIN